MNRRTSNYVFVFEPKMVAPGSVDTQLGLALHRLENTLPLGSSITGSGLRNSTTAFVRFRTTSDDEAIRIARVLAFHGRGPSEGEPRFNSATLSTGLAVHERTIDF